MPNYLYLSIVKVTSAEIALPLFVAPVLGGARLAAIEKVRIMTSDCDSSKFGKAGQPIPPPSSKVGGVELPGSPPSPPPCVEGESGTGCDMIPEDEVDQTDCDETETEHFLKVETVRRYNDTALVFLMANNQALYVWNGETVYVDAEGTSFPVCEATATCAALYVDDNDEKEQLEKKAHAALEAGGFTEAAGRRQLSHFFCDACRVRAGWTVGKTGGKTGGTEIVVTQAQLERILEGNPDFCTSACLEAIELGPRRSLHYGHVHAWDGTGSGYDPCSTYSHNSKQKGKGAIHRSTSVLTSTTDEELLRCLKSSSFMDCIELFD